MAKLVIKGMGLKGVCVDKNPLELDDDELAQSTNAGADPNIGASSIRKRPGLVAFTTSTSAGTILGGTTLPLQDLSASGVHYIYIGRGST